MEKLLVLARTKDEADMFIDKLRPAAPELKLGRYAGWTYWNRSLHGWPSGQEFVLLCSTYEFQAIHKIRDIDMEVFRFDLKEGRSVDKTSHYFEVINEFEKSN